MKNTGGGLKQGSCNVGEVSTCRPMYHIEEDTHCRSQLQCLNTINKILLKLGLSLSIIIIRLYIVAATGASTSSTIQIPNSI